MVCGLFLTVSVIGPVTDLDFSYVTAFADSFSQSAQSAASVGTRWAEEAQREIIKSETEAYILDKAAAYGLQIEVDVTLADGEQPKPERVTLSGAASPYARGKMQTLIADELGIPKERQLWTG